MRAQLALGQLLTHNRDQAGRDVVGLAHVVDNIGQNQTEGYINGVGGQGPVHKGGTHGPNDRLIAARLQMEAGSRLKGEDQRLDGAPEHDAGADASAEGNDEPLPVGHFWFGIGAAQLDLADGVEDNHGHECHKQQHGQADHPAQVVLQDLKALGQCVGKGLTDHQGQNDDHNENRGRDQQHRWPQLGFLFHK